MGSLYIRPYTWSYCKAYNRAYALCPNSGDLCSAFNSLSYGITIHREKMANSMGSDRRVLYHCLCPLLKGHYFFYQGRILKIILKGGFVVKFFVVLFLVIFVLWVLVCLGGIVLSFLGFRGIIKPNGKVHHSENKKEADDYSSSFCYGDDKTREEFRYKDPEPYHLPKEEDNFESRYPLCNPNNDPDFEDLLY
jgi:hypothetical protein